MKRTSTGGAAALALMAFLQAAEADQQAEMVRNLVARHTRSVVTLAFVIKVSSGEFGDTQTEREANGLLLNSAGLVATTNTAVDPTSLLEGETGEGIGGKMSSRVVSMKIITSSGDELPARVVLRDKDRNLAFVRPVQKPDISLEGVDFRRGGKARIGDPVYILGRLGRTGNRNVVMTVERVVSLIEKPRLLYVIQHNDYASLGNIIFNEQGKPLGMLSMKFRSGRSGITSTEDYLPVVIPADDVWDIARQAPQVKDVKATSGVRLRPPPKPSGSRTPPATPSPGKQPSKRQPARKPAAKR